MHAATNLCAIPSYFDPYWSFVFDRWVFVNQAFTIHWMKVKIPIHLYTGNHVIAMLNAQEKYENLSESVKDISEEIKSIKSITIDGHKFEIEIFYGGRHEVPCNLCRYTICKCYLFLYMVQMPSWEEAWYLTIMVHHRRSQNNQRNPRCHWKKKDLKYGCIDQPLFPSIEHFQHVI